MRILYGVVGEGMGHAIRSGVILDELVKNHEVQVVVSGRAHDYLSKRIGPHLDVKKIWGLTIVTEDNEVRNFKTLLQNVKGALGGGWPENVRAYFDVAERFRPDVVVSDFETWSYLFAVNRGLPVISVDNMQIINRCRHDPAILQGHEADFQIAKAVVKAKLPGAFHYLVTTFFYPELRKEGTTLHPPILRPEILAAKSEKGEHLLVYQTYTTNAELPALLEPLGRECRIYGLRRGLTEPVREGNLTYLPFNEHGFIEDLRTARAVIAGGGFTLMGEAVYLHKPMLSEPVGKQFEQVLNARYLESLGYGLSAERFSAERLGEFLDGLPRFEARLAGYSQDGNRSLFAKLEETIGEAARK
ncbi:MAG: teichoic acid biosynthesis protein [Deltaproteobacteria bacterium]|nr:MAG: teichoic acid biosynthesis protein [Deltaproteobacteria bacterium]TMB35839.1 MAG: teichoic acid biosynthesis protein [Deltaproteobacteria bacterium]